MMYTVSNKSSKLVATRRGISQNYETYRDLGRPEISLPKPVFHTTPRKHQHQEQNMKMQMNLNPQHEEIVKFIHDSWCTVAVDGPYDVPSSPDSAISINSSSSRLNPNGHHHTMSKSSSTSSNSSTSTSSGYAAPAQMYYTDKPDSRLQDFKPFDLEAWWGRRLYQNITKSL